jgi:hypothetical protein
MLATFYVFPLGGNSMIRSPKISMDGSILTINLGESRVSAHVDDVQALAKILEGVGLLASTGALSSMSLDAAPPRALAVGEEEVTDGGSGRSKKRRKSRKNVGNALIIWLRAHPGWHSEEDLLKMVIAHRMSDAAPHRALKIALGRKKDEIFVTDGLGNWRLKEDHRPGSAESLDVVTKDDESRLPEADTRWDSSNAQEIARARRNLLGL